MKCQTCNGTGKIPLLVKTVDCPDCSEEEAPLTSEWEFRPSNAYYVGSLDIDGNYFDVPEGTTLKTDANSVILKGHGYDGKKNTILSGIFPDKITELVQWMNSRKAWTRID